MAMSNSIETQRDRGSFTGVTPIIAPEIRELEARVHAASEWLEPLKRQMGSVIVGQRLLVDRLIVGLLTQGHLLLEGVPGLAKTLALKTLAGCLHGARFRRIQFTPDMLPSDIVGTMIYRAQTGTFEAKRGPVFANLVLADEINRAPAKVQSALLEAMQERQVTLGDETLRLPEPFLVLATQNPLEQEGTYPLPEAQLDRFLLKVRVRYPELAEERAILDAMALSEPSTRVEPRVELEDVARARRVVDQIYVDDAVRDYVVRLVAATREPGRYRVPIEGLLRAGVSPRGTIGLALAARATAFLNRRGYVVPQDVKDVAHDVLRHRLTLSFEAEASGIDADEIVTRVLQAVVSP
jgi:MoxR-like ATPase